MSHPLSRLERLAGLLAVRSPLRVDDPGRRQAAVSVVLAPDPDAILFIRRAEHPEDPWSGQMAFPGGRQDPTDPDLRFTAIRETAEELGLTLPASAFLGDLDDMAPNTPVLPPVNVRPFVFGLDRRPEDLIPNHEVAGVVWAPLDLLLDPGTFRPFTYEHGGYRTRRMGYHLKEGVVWGMSERILSPLLDLLRG